MNGIDHGDQASKPPLMTWAQSATRWLHGLSVNDWLLFVFLVVLNLAWLGSSAGADKARAGPIVVGNFVLFVVGVLFYARSTIGPIRARALVYRLVQFGCIEISYFSFQHLLPAANHGTLDRELYQLDLDLFGIEPALWMDQFVTAGTVEWFSFFYFSYYLLLLAHVVPIIFISNRALHVAEFGLGMTIVGTLGQACYLVVPGFGPYHAFAELFRNPFPSGFWWNQVTALVHAGGAQKDIFPSLHTALPTYILLFALRHRHETAYRRTWPIVAFFTLNIVISTMFLRWHYLIDVIAGLALAAAARFASPWLTSWEQARREQRQLGPTWPAWTDDGQAQVRSLPAVRH